MAAHVPMDQPCGECESCSCRDKTLVSHPASFKVVFNSQTDGFNFRANEFTTNQIAEAFANLIPGHMNWQIKKIALESGPSMWTPMVRPSSDLPRSVYNILCVLMHERCHELLFLACECSICSCGLHQMDGWGMTGHGPGWQRVRAAVQGTANLHLKRFSEPLLLAYRSELDVRQELGAGVKLLEGLYKKVIKEGNEAEREKKVERTKRIAVQKSDTLKNDQRKADNDETLANVVAIFEGRKEIAGAIAEEQTRKEGSIGELGPLAEIRYGEDYKDSFGKDNEWDVGGVW